MNHLFRSYQNPTTTKELMSLLNKECQNKVQDSIVKKEEAAMFFCIPFRIYLYQCPIKCPYFLKGSPISMKVIYTNDFEMECPHFQYIGKNPTIKNDSGFFYCTFTGKHPLCNHCPFDQEKTRNDIMSKEFS